MTEPNWDIPCSSDLWFPSFSYQLSTPKPEKCGVLGPLGLMSQSTVQVDQSGTTTLHDCTATIYFFWGISFSVFLYGTQQGSLIASKKKSQTEFLSASQEWNEDLIRLTTAIAQWKQITYSIDWHQQRTLESQNEWPYENKKLITN